jgi:hypothetical protein
MGFLAETTERNFSKSWPFNDPIRQGKETSANRGKWAILESHGSAVPEESVMPFTALAGVY